MASRRYQFHFRETEKQALLKAIGECRRACIVGGTHSLFDRKEVQASCYAINEEIDNLAALLTGNRQYFWSKSHSSSDYEPAEPKAIK